MKTATLKYAAKVSPDGVQRLAQFLKLNTSGMSIRQVVRLIKWRLSPARKWGK